MTTQTYTQAKRQLQRKLFAEIEAILHPCPVVSGLDILHEHKGQYIYFSAWKGDDPANHKRLRMHRLSATIPNFYTDHAEEFNWLASGDEIRPTWTGRIAE